MDPIELPDDVGFTAIQLAAERERETSRPDALFNDPLAVALINQVRGDREDGPDPYLSADTQSSYGDFAALRTNFIDEQIMAVVRDIGQIVVLAAGLDGRCYRLPLSAGTRVYEVDRAEVFDFKQQVVQRAGLQPTAGLVPVVADLHQDWPALLEGAGFVAEQPTLWIVEGILSYLEQDAADRLITQVSSLSACSSRLVAIYNVGDLTAVARRAGRYGDEGITTISKFWKSGPSKEPVAWLSSHDWQAEATMVAAWAERLGRPIPPAMDPRIDGVPYYFATARRS